MQYPANSVVFVVNVMEALSILMGEGGCVWILPVVFVKCVVLIKAIYQEMCS